MIGQTSPPSDWTVWQDIDGARTEQRGCYGIYQIRMVDGSRNPITIHRIAGDDEEGIVCIGRAKPRSTLGNRIHAFLNGSHSEGETYELMCKVLSPEGHILRNHSLEYRVVRLFPDAPPAEVESDGQEQEVLPENMYKRKIKGEEVKALATYFSSYGELPPCNSSFPEKWGNFLKALKMLLRED